MRSMRFHATLRRILPLVAFLLMAGTCEDGGPLGEDEEACDFGAQEERCKVSISMRNASNQPIHLWAGHESIGPLNRLDPGTERCVGSLVLPGTSHTFTVSAGRDGEQEDTRSTTITVRGNTVILADWSGTAIGPLRTREGTVAVCAG